MHRRLILIASSLSLVCVPQLLAPARAAAAAAAGPARLVLPAKWFEVVDPYRYVEARRYEAGWNRGADVVIRDGAVRAPVTGRVQFAGRVAGRGVVTIATRLGGVPVVVTLTGLEATAGMEEGAPIARGAVVGRAARLHVGAYDRRRRSRYLPVVGAPPGAPPSGRGSDAAAVGISGAIARRLEDAIGGVAGTGGVEPVAVPGASLVVGAAGAAGAGTGAGHGRVPGAARVAATPAVASAGLGVMAAGSDGAGTMSFVPRVAHVEEVARRDASTARTRVRDSGVPNAHPVPGIAADLTTAIEAARRALVRARASATAAMPSPGDAPARSVHGPGSASDDHSGTGVRAEAGNPPRPVPVRSATTGSSGDVPAAPSGTFPRPGGWGPVAIPLPGEPGDALGAANAGGASAGAASAGGAPVHAEPTIEHDQAGDGVGRASALRRALGWAVGLGGACAALVLALAGALLLRRLRRGTQCDPPSPVLAPLPVLVPRVELTAPARDRAQLRPAQAIESPDRGRVLARTRHGHERDRAPEHA